ncbi:putative metalloprotease with PDZ domain [Bradyrhizobium embrapense]
MAKGNKPGDRLDTSSKRARARLREFVNRSKEIEPPPVMERVKLVSEKKPAPQNEPGDE